MKPRPDGTKEAAASSPRRDDAAGASIARGAEVAPAEERTAPADDYEANAREEGLEDAGFSDEQDRAGRPDKAVPLAEKTRRRV